MKTAYLKSGIDALGFYGKKFYHENKAHIFTGLSIAGTIATGAISAKDGARAARRIDQKSIELGRELTNGEKFKLCWKDFLDAGLICAGACAATVASDAINTRTIADRTTLLIASEKAYEQLSKKTKEVIGEKKYKEVKDEMVKEKIQNQKPPHVITQTDFDHAPRVGDGALYPMILEYCWLPFWSNLDYLNLWVMKMNGIMSDLEPRDNTRNYLGQKIGVPFSEFVSAIGYDHKIACTPERRNHGWNKGYAKDGSDDDIIAIEHHSVEYSPGFAVTMISFEQDPRDMTCGGIFKSNGL